jgi:hypothetical protein
MDREMTRDNCQFPLKSLLMGRETPICQFPKLPVPVGVAVAKISIAVAVACYTATASYFVALAVAVNRVQEAPSELIRRATSLLGHLSQLKKMFGRRHRDRDFDLLQLLHVSLPELLVDVSVELFGF